MDRPPNRYLRCRACGAREQPDAPTVGPRATGVTVVRSVARLERPAAEVVCQTCGHAWYSPTRRARELSRAAHDGAADGPANR